MAPSMSKKHPRNQESTSQSSKRARTESLSNLMPASAPTLHSSQLSRSQSEVSIEPIVRPKTGRRGKSRVIIERDTDEAESASNAEAESAGNADEPVNSDDELG
jgi:hypothetical protein